MVHQKVQLELWQELDRLGEAEISQARGAVLPQKTWESFNKLNKLMF